MSRQVSVAVQTGDDYSVVIDHDLEYFVCGFTKQIFFDPVVTDCGQHIERSVSTKLKRCLYCNQPNIQFNEPSAFFKRTLEEMIQQYDLYENVYFDLEGFKQVIAKSQLNTPIAVKFLTLLQNSTSHLNNEELIRTETQVTHPAYLEIPQFTVVETREKSAIERLAETFAGRDLLRKKCRIDTPSGKFLFGNSEISRESLQIQVSGKSILEWLSMTTAMELMQEEEQKARTAIDVETQATYCQLQTQFSRARLFLLRSERGIATADHRMQSDVVNPILQKVVYGEEGKVKEALEAIKSNAAQLSALLSDTGTVKDYSDRTITGMTLLQAAAAAGDIDMCLMLKNYMVPEEFAAQLAEIFPKGIEAHEINQKRNTFNFDIILAAIQAANTTDLDSALNKQNNGSALCYALEKFRRQATEISHGRKIFNPHHLLRAFEAYITLWNQCERDDSDCYYKKRNLFWRQIIGFFQRFMPACYAQAFAQGLYYLVSVEACQSALWRPETFNRDLKLRCYDDDDDDDDFSYFPLLVDLRSGLGFDFAIYSWDYVLATRSGGLAGCFSHIFFQELLSSKNSWLKDTLFRECECSRATSLMNVTA